MQIKLQKCASRFIESKEAKVIYNFFVINIIADFVYFILPLLSFFWPTTKSVVRNAVGGLALCVLINLDSKKFKLDEID